MKHSILFILLFGMLALSPWKEGLAQAENQRGNTGTSDTMNAPADTINTGPSDTTGNKPGIQDRKNMGSSGTTGNNRNSKNRTKTGDTGAKGRDSSGMGSESGTGGVPR